MSASDPPTPRGHFTGLEYHSRLLADLHRMDAYERAIRELVRPGDVVLDLGAGTGILAMLAARRGAARVHAVESTPMAEVAEELVRANGLADRVHVHRADAVTMAPIEPVDLVVSDFLGRFLVDDQMLDAVAAARRWLAPGGRFCPAVVELWVAPVGNFLLEAVEVFRDPVFGLDFTPALGRALRRPYASRLRPAACLSEPRLFTRYEPACEDAPTLDARFDLELSASGKLAALAGWFRAELAPGVSLSTEPGIVSHWGQFLFPVPAVVVEPGDRLAMRLWLEGDPAARGIWRWEGRISRSGEVLTAFELADDTARDGPPATGGAP